MKRIYTLSVTLLTLIALSGSAIANPTSNVGAHTDELSVHVQKTLSSATSAVGDSVEFVASNDFRDDSHVVIAANAEGSAKIIRVEKAGKHGHRGTFVLVPEWITDTTGQKRPLRADQLEVHGNNDVGMVGLVSGASAVTFGAAGLLFGHNFVHGGDVKLDPTKSFLVHLSTSEATALPTPLPDHT